MNDPFVWSGRALQVESVELEIEGLASMYQAFVWSFLAPAHHEYERIIALISGRALDRPNGSPGFDNAGKTGSPGVGGKMKTLTSYVSTCAGIKVKSSADCYQL